MNFGSPKNFRGWRYGVLQLEMKTLMLGPRVTLKATDLEISVFFAFSFAADLWLIFNNKCVDTDLIYNSN